MSGPEPGPERHPCPNCGEPASGNFCQHCGASMGGRFCTQCGAQLTPGSRFCNQCGKPINASSPAAGAGPAQAPGAHRAAAAAAVGGGNLPWWIAGVAMFVMILVVGYFTVRKAPPTAQPSGSSQAGNPAAGASAIDLSSMTPIQAADSLFDHVMRDLSAGDTADALDFQPMAVAAYRRAEPLDLGGLFDMSLLQRMTDPDSALVTAKRILSKDPNHILGLGAAAEAELGLGDSVQAAKYYRRLLDVYPAQERDTTTSGYLAHKPLLSLFRSEAQKYLAQHGK